MSLYIECIGRFENLTTFPENVFKTSRVGSSDFVKTWCSFWQFLCIPGDLTGFDYNWIANPVF